jgi:AcrR family transcriptional regulator/DNA-binding HxlR family transcriptional regulator
VPSAARSKPRRRRPAEAVSPSLHERRAGPTEPGGPLVVSAAPGVRELSRSRAAEIQRERLLAAAVAIVADGGYEKLTVAELATTAAVARSTFYQLFANAEECLLAALERTSQSMIGELGDVSAIGLPWRERIHTGLARILEFLDREPAVARVWLLHSEQAGPRVREHRDQVIGRLTSAIDAGHGERAPELIWSRVTAEGQIGAVLRILATHVTREEPGGAVGLLGDLAAMIVLPYLGAQAAREEQARAAPEAQPHLAPPLLSAPAAPTQLVGVRMRLTHRTAETLEIVAAEPGASNRQLATHMAISEPQISKLLARLERLGLVINLTDGTGKGPRNAWYLTPLGQRLLPTVTPTSGEQESRAGPH